MCVKMATPDLTSYISSTMSYLEEKVAVGNSKLTDVSISCLINDEDLASYSFNASLLAYQSPFLKDVLNSIATTDRYQIILPDVKITTLRHLKDLLYSGR